MNITISIDNVQVLVFTVPGTTQVTTQASAETPTPGVSEATQAEILHALDSLSNESNIPVTEPGRAATAVRYEVPDEDDDDAYDSQYQEPVAVNSIDFNSIPNADGTPVAPATPPAPTQSRIDRAFDLINNL